MGNYFGVAAPTGYSQNEAGDGPKSSRNKRSGAGKEKAAKNWASMETSGVTEGGDGTTAATRGTTTATRGGTTEATGTTRGRGTTEGTGMTRGGATTDASGTTVGGTTDVTKATGVSQTGGVPDETGVTQTGVNYETAVGQPEKVKPLYELPGLEDDSDTEWEEWDGPTRIKDSQLTAAQRAKFQRHLDQIFSYDTAVLGVRYVFDPEDVVEVMEAVIPYLESEPVLIEDVPFNINIVGDIHGQLYDLHRIFRHDAKDGKPGWECRKFIFMGDYVDRGRQALEVVMALFCIKMLYPDDIFLLRGNHEFLHTNFSYGFYQDLKDRYEQETARDLYLTINKTFCYLSIAAILGDDYFCAHGGISLEGFTRDNLKSFEKPIVCSDEDTLIHDLVWSDPAIGIKATVFNGIRGSSFYFGMGELAHALSSMEVSVIFRGHTVLNKGYEVNWHCLISVFSATDIGGKNPNRGAVARLDENGKLSFDVLEVSSTRHLWQREIRRLAGDPLDEKEDENTEFEHGTGQIVKIGGGH